MRRKSAPSITLVTSIALLLSVCASVPLTPDTLAQSAAGENQSSAVAEVRLRKYCADLTLLAGRGKLESTAGYDEEIARVIESLAGARNPVVIGESDLQRDAIARGVAVRIAQGEVPADLRTKRVFRLSLDALAKEAQTSAEFVARVQAVFAEAAESRNQVILFVDQLHQYAGGRAEAAASAAVQTAIETNHLQVMGGDSQSAYAAYIASDTKLAKLFLTKSLAVDDSKHWIIDLDLALREGICNLVIVPSNWIVKAPTFSLVHFLVRL